MVADFAPTCSLLLIYLKYYFQFVDNLQTIQQMAILPGSYNLFSPAMFDHLIFLFYLGWRIPLPKKITVSGLVRN